MKPDLDDLLARYVTPALTGAGFVRAQRRYTVASPDGNLVIVEFSPWNSDRVGFHIEYSALPAVVREYYSGGDLSETPDLM